MKKPAYYKNMRNRFLCIDCGLSFQVLGVLSDKRKARPFCPECGEHWEVRSEKSVRANEEEKRGEKTVYIRWTEEENNLMDDCISGKLTPNQVSNLTGRPIGSVYRKKARRIEELKRRGQVEKYS